MEQNTEKFSIPNSQFSILTSYFPDLTDRQKEQYAALYDLYTDWNAKINVISRKDIENLYPHHVLHSQHIGDTQRVKHVMRISRTYIRITCFTRWVSPICCVSSRVPR